METQHNSRSLVLVAQQQHVQHAASQPTAVSSQQQPCSFESFALPRARRQPAQPEFTVVVPHSRMRSSPGIHATQSARRLSEPEGQTYGAPSASFLLTCATVRELHLVPRRAQLELSAFGTNADTQVPPLTAHARKRAFGHAERVTIRVASRAAERGCRLRRSVIMIRCSTPKQDAF